MNNPVYFILNDIFWKSYTRPFFWKLAVVCVVAVQIMMLILFKDFTLEMVFEGKRILQYIGDILLFYPVVFYIACGRDMLKAERATLENKEDDSA
jgi:hypothetical protein